jgi:hypothetical protein
MHTALLHIGFVTGIPQVRISQTVPVPANTIPVAGAGTYRPVNWAVCDETRGVTHTRSNFMSYYIQSILIQFIN